MFLYFLLQCFTHKTNEVKKLDQDFEVVPVPVELAKILGIDGNHFETSVALNVPPELMKVLGWDDHLDLMASIDKGSLYIYKKDPEIIYEEIEEI